MTANTINADETYKTYTITQDHDTGFWYVSSPSQSDTAGNELYGKYTTRDELKWAIRRFG